MREILFRGKRKDNGKWIEGGVCQTEGYTIILTFEDFEGTLYEPPSSELYDIEVIPETVGQFTGLTDKNGKKIFEGDIVERVSDGERAVISWLKYSACFGLSFDGWCCGFDNYDDNLPSDFEVIGNIHDNPEILKTPSP